MTDEDWRSLLNRASQLRRAGQVEEAIAAYQRLLAVKPDLPDSWYNVARLQREARRFEDALASYARALDLHVADPEEVHLNRAVIYSDHLNLPGEAERELNAALDHKPGYVPALLNLGNLREDLGERESAREAYHQVLAADPDNRVALARLAGLSHAPELDHGLAKRLRAALSAPGVSHADQADLGFALAGLLDAAAKYSEAFEAARAANLASRRASGARYDPRASEQMVDRLISAFSKPVAAGGEGEAPVFICGMFRSGSTLVEQILGAHEAVTAAGELDLIPELVAGIPGYPESVRVAPESVGQWRRVYVRGLPSRLRHNHLVTDKRPDNFLHIGLIKTIFPSAKIVHTRRNRLDNLVSLHLLHLDPAMSYGLDLEDAAHWYAQYERLMAHWKALYPEDLIDVDYDELVREPEPVLRRLLSFLDLNWTKNLLQFHRRRAAVKTASVWQVRRPLHARSSGRWSNYSAQLEEALGDLGR